MEKLKNIISKLITLEYGPYRYNGLSIEIAANLFTHIVVRDDSVYRSIINSCEYYDIYDVGRTS